MPKYIKKKDLKRAVDNCTWYHINKNGELVEGANPADHEPLYKYSDIKKIIKGLPTRKINDEENEPYIDIETGILHWHGWKYRRIGDCRDTVDTPQTEQTEPSGYKMKPLEQTESRDLAQDLATGKESILSIAIKGKMERRGKQTDCGWK